MKRFKTGLAIGIVVMVAFIGSLTQAALDLDRLPPPPPLFPGEVSFTEITAEAGVVGDGGWYNAASFGDIDHDGDLDLFVTSRKEGSDYRDKFYRNNGDGTFEDFTDASGISTYGSSCGIFGDIDNDGDLDLLISRHPDFPGDGLYENDGTGRFTDISASSGISTDSSGAIFGDIDNDGDLDLCVIPRNGDETNILYQNDGNGVFSISEAGLAARGRMAFADVDDDGYLDLYVLGHLVPNVLYRNNGNGTFTDVTNNAGVGSIGYSQGLAFGDIDSDGDLDLYVTYGGYSPADSENVLYLNNGDGTFADITGSAGVQNSNLQAGVTFGDFDHDGDLDLYMGGMAIGIRGRGPSVLYQNNGDNTFTEITEASGTLANTASISAIRGDIDNDGDLDIFLVSHYADPNYLFRNDQNDDNWLKVRLIGTQSNSFGVGAKVKVRHNGELMGFREIRAGSSYNSMNPLEAHFGLDSAYTYDVKVDWPSGINQVVTDVATNQAITIIEDGNGPLTIDLTQPSSNITVAPDGTVNIAWTGNGPSGSYVSLRRDNDNVWDNGGVGEAWIAANRPVSGSYPWDTSGVSSGTYYIAGMITDGTQSAHGYALGTVTIPPPDGGIPVRIFVASPQPAETDFWVDISVGDENFPVNDLFGMSFKLGYTNTDIIDAVEAVQGDFLGVGGLFFPTIDDLSGTVSVGMSRKAGTAGVSGSGVVARIKMRFTSDAHGGGTSVLSLVDVTANDSNGNPIELVAESAIVEVDGIVVWPGDTNNDGKVDERDILPIGMYWQSTGPSRESASSQWVGQAATAWDPAAATYADATGDGIVDERDILPIGLNWHKTHEVPAAAPPKAIASIDHSPYLPAYESLLKILESSPETGPIVKMRGMLKDVISIAKRQSIPKRTDVFQNYPNPFNPETWIPFQLAESTEVKITIYNTAGLLIRTLDLGHKEAGIYKDRSFAAYWDGRSNYGEEVASGIYFYRIQAGDFNSVVKMILEK